MGKLNIPKNINVIYTKNYCDLREVEELKHIIYNIITYSIKNKTKNGN